MDKQKIRRAFAAAAARYDGLAALQRQAGQELLRRFPPQPATGVWLDVGCGTGFLTDLLGEYAAGEGRLLALDLAFPMLQACRLSRPGLAANYLCADAERLPFADASLERIYSNVALQWVQDLSGALAGFYRVLRPGGRLTFAIFGPATLGELKAAWAAVDGYDHVNSFHAVADIEAMLLAAGFNQVRIDNVVYRSFYPSVETLMRELKGIGANQVKRGRNPKLTTKNQLQAMKRAYQELMDGPDITASYEIIFVEAWV